MVSRSGPSRAASMWGKQYEGGTRYIQVPMAHRALVLEDALARQLTFREWLGSAGLKIASSVSAAIKQTEQENFDIIFIDRDLGLPVNGLGEDFAAHLTKTSYQGIVICHSANPTGAEFVKRAFPAAQIIPYSMLAVVRVPD